MKSIRIKMPDASVSLRNPGSVAPLWAKKRHSKIVEQGEGAVYRLGLQTQDVIRSNRDIPYVDCNSLCRLINWELKGRIKMATSHETGIRRTENQ